MPPPPNPKSSPSADRAYIALLRGINVGGKNKLPMSDLAQIFVEAGCAEVRTYIQSGNVVFSARAKASVKHVSASVSAAIKRRFRIEIPVVLRTADELRRIAAGNPFLKPKVDPKSLHVVFLADRPDPRRIAALDPKRSPGDSFKLHGREIYLHLPNGVGRTKFTNDYFDATLRTTSTVRNWRTVQKLLELAESIG